jgi:hypothetical protein
VTALSQALQSPRIHAAAAVAAFALYAAALLRALNVDGLSSMASDSVHYLLMARHLSPWGASDSIAAAAWVEQEHPPLFGLLLGLFDAGGNFRIAHLLTGALLLIALPLLWRYSARLTGSRGAAFAVTAIVAVCPGAWLNSLDVLSENLYLLLSLVILERARSEAADSMRSLVVTGLLAAALILTRSVGFAMLGAIAATGLLRGRGARSKALAAGVPVAICMALLLVAEIISGAGVPDQYLRGFERLAGARSPHGTVEAAGYLAGQARAVWEAWLGNWLYYWNAVTWFNTACFSIAGLLGLAGAARGARHGRVDALYVLLYLAVIAAWPHPGQMTRFIYPVAPLLLALAAAESFRLAGAIRLHRGPLLASLFLLLLCVAVLPSLIYTWQRYDAGQNTGLGRMTEFYRLPDPGAATLEASVHAQMEADFARIGTLLPVDAAILYYEPAYIALLAGRRGLRLADAAAVQPELPDGRSYLLLTRFDPRHWRAGEDRLAGPGGPGAWSDPLYRSVSAVDSRPVSVLFAVRGG